MYSWFCFRDAQAGNQSNMSSTKGTEGTNEEGAVETRVETTDYRTSAGETEPTPEKIEVVHLTQKGDTGSRGGIAGNQSNMSSTKGIEGTNEEGAVETRVETTDYRTSAGETEPTPEKIEVVHLTHKGDTGSKGGILTGAADAVVKTFESAKDAVSGNRKDDNKNSPK